MAKECRNVNRAPGWHRDRRADQDVVADAAGSAANARLGAVSGIVAFVTQRFAVPVSVLVAHPAGRAGAVTPSKFWLKKVDSRPPPGSCMAGFASPRRSPAPARWPSPCRRTRA